MRLESNEAGSVQDMLAFFVRFAAHVIQIGVGLGVSSPIGMELMVDPVMVATGHTYDRLYIERWLGQGNRTCPITGMRLRHLELTPNFAMRKAIQVCSHSQPEEHTGDVEERARCAVTPSLTDMPAMSRKELGVQSLPA